MRLRTAVTALALATGVLIPAGPALATDVQPLIIGGGTVSSAPWAAAVFRSGSFTCSGTIIGAQWVLTARHCTGGAMNNAGQMFACCAFPAPCVRMTPLSAAAAAAWAARRRNEFAG